MAKGWKQISVKDDTHDRLIKQFTKAKNPTRIQFTKWLNNLLLDYLERMDEKRA